MLSELMGPDRAFAQPFQLSFQLWSHGFCLPTTDRSTSVSPDPSASAARPFAAWTVPKAWRLSVLRRRRHDTIGVVASVEQTELCNCVGHGSFVRSSVRSLFARWLLRLRRTLLHRAFLRRPLSRRSPRAGPLSKLPSKNYLLVAYLLVAYLLVAYLLVTYFLVTYLLKSTVQIYTTPL